MVKRRKPPLRSIYRNARLDADAVSSAPPPQAGRKIPPTRRLCAHDAPTMRIVGVTLALLALTSAFHLPPLATPSSPRVSPLAMLSDSSGTPSLTKLIDEALRLTTEAGEADRQSLVETTVVSWVPSERQRLSDELSDLISERAAAVQKDALKRHDAGEDVSEASETLQTLVDMTVQVKLLTRQLNKASESA